MFGLGAPEFMFVMLFGLLSHVIPFALFVTLAVLAIRWLLRQERTAKNPEVQRVRGTLAEVLRAHREQARMTQELVAQELGVSRQAVGKWETGRSEPSTSNLVRLAHLYGIDAAELLREVDVTPPAKPGAPDPR